MLTPDNFNGIFYSPQTGSDNIFSYQEAFVDEISDREDGLFLSLGAYVDLVINGYAELANKIFYKTKEVWPDIDWTRVEKVLQDVHELSFRQPDNWRHEVYEMVSYSFLGAKHQVPETYRSFYFDPETVKVIFALRGQIVTINHEHFPDSYTMPIRVLVDCDLNHETELATEISDMLSFYQPDADWLFIAHFRQIAQSMAELSLSRQVKPLFIFKMDDVVSVVSL
ncbi:hypothetical protein M1116_03440 [Patescibacteria group bacterium]|nr:hypothetical protein [Patescibacteria group bacterium]